MKLVEVGGFFGLILLIADVWAIVNVFGSNRGTGAKVLWILGVLVFPLLGFLVWLFIGPRSVKAGRRERGTASPRRRRGRASLVGLAAFLGAVFIAMLVAGLATRVGVNGWYADAVKPFWTPPAWVFTPVWTTLYALMAVAAWIIWRRKGWHGARIALLLFFLQLGLNVLWPILFFTLRLTGWASLEIILLLLVIVATAWRFDRHSRVAAALLVPYAVWVGYAATISIAVWLMMPGTEGATAPPV